MVTLVRETVFGEQVVNTQRIPIIRVPGVVAGLSFAGGIVTFADAPDGRVNVGRRGEFEVGGDVLRFDSGVVRLPSPETAEAKPAEAPSQ